MKHFAIVISVILFLLLVQTIAGQQTGEIHKAVYAGDLNKIRSLIETDSTLEAGLANGHFNPNELAGQKITAFMSIPRGKRGWSSVNNMAKQMPEVNWVFFAGPTDSIPNYVHLLSYQLIGFDKNLSIGDIQVHTFGPMNDDDLGYIVEDDGMKIYCGGGHVYTNEASEVARYHKEIDNMKPFGPIDIAILRVRGHFSNAYEPYLYLLDQLTPKAVYLVGGAGMPDEYQKCAEALRISNIQMNHPEARIGGDRFHYICN